MLLVMLVVATSFVLTSCDIIINEAIKQAESYEYFAYSYDSSTDGYIVSASKYLDSIKGVSTLVIPSTHSGKSVVAVDKNAFEGCSNIRQVTIPDSILIIGNSAFCDCTGLNAVNMGTGIIAIGSYAFGNCKNLYNINYTGSKTQWSNILTLPFWRLGSNIYTVYCSDETYYYSYIY